MTAKELHPKPAATATKESAVQYDKYLYKKILFIVFLLVAVFVVSVAYIGYGDYHISFIDVVKIIFGDHSDKTAYAVVTVSYTHLTLPTT